MGKENPFGKMDGKVWRCEIMSNVDRLANCSCLVKDRGGFSKRKKEVGKKKYF